MHEVLDLAKRELACHYTVLQASDAGEGLYRSLGFKAQFMIKNYFFTN